jgi:hypothetical protein
MRIEPLRKQVTFYETNFHWGRDAYPLLRSGRQRPEYGMETSDIAGQKEVQNSTIGVKIDIGNFCDIQGPILEHCRERRTIINSVRYSEILRDQMKLAIRTRHRGLLSNCVSMSRENARPHNVAHTAESPRQLNVQVLKYPAHSPDLAPSDSHLFGSITDTLRNHHFTSDQKVTEAVHTWLVTEPKILFSFSEGTRSFRTTGVC